MRWIWVSIFLLSNAAVCQERTLTNREGKQVTAEIEAVRSGKVFLKRDGRRFEVPFKSLSDEDQIYLREWVKHNFNYKFTYRPTLKEDTSKRTSEREGDLKKKSSRWCYSVKIDNRSGIKAEDLRIEYRMVIRQTKLADLQLSGNIKKQSGLVKSGEESIASIDNTGAYTLETRWVECPERKWKTRKTQRVTNSDGSVTNEYYYDDYEDNTDLAGIWIRIYNGKRIISEFKTQDKGIEILQWDQQGQFEIP